MKVIDGRLLDIKYLMGLVRSGMRLLESGYGIKDRVEPEIGEWHGSTDRVSSLISLRVRIHTKLVDVGASKVNVGLFLHLKAG